jgi:hypothetical protein
MTQEEERQVVEALVEFVTRVGKGRYNTTYNNGSVPQAEVAALPAVVEQLRKLGSGID